MQDLVEHSPVKITEAIEPTFKMKPRNLDEAMAFAKLMSESELVPSSYRGKPGNVLVAIQLGSELGMTPMRALRSIAVINSRATLWGDDMLAMVLNSPVCEYVNEADSTDKQGVCKTKRKGCAEQVSTFTLEDAKRAGLLGKQGPWQTHTKRMLMLRARGFGLRDTFADVLAGLVTTEEALDLPRIEPEDAGTNILEANEPLSLKDKLKAKVEDTEPKGAVLEPSVKEALKDMGEQDGAVSNRVQGAESEPLRSTQQASDAAHPPKTFNQILMEIDANPDWCLAKVDWKDAKKIKNLSTMTPQGQAKFLEDMRAKIGPSFPY